MANTCHCQRRKTTSYNCSFLWIKQAFLEDFLCEYPYLIESGIKTKIGIKQFEIKCFTCDAPARQFLKSIKGHTGYNSCECTVKGEIVNRTMTFKDTSSPLRTDFDFNAFSYHNHQHCQSILSE